MSNNENTFIFEPEEDAQLIIIENALAKAMEYLKDLICQASDNLKYGQYEVYMKDFTYLKFILSQMGELQEMYSKFKNSDNIQSVRPSDINSKIEDILKHIETYKTSNNTNTCNRSQKPEIKINPDKNDKNNFGDILW